eukprot:2393814-Karenia_brevis.AAC.1
MSITYSSPDWDLQVHSQRNQKFAWSSPRLRHLLSTQHQTWDIHSATLVASDRRQPEKGLS